MIVVLERYLKEMLLMYQWKCAQINKHIPLIMSRFVAIKDDQMTWVFFYPFAILADLPALYRSTINSGRSRRFVLLALREGHLYHNGSVYSAER